MDPEDMKMMVLDSDVEGNDGNPGSMDPKKIGELLRTMADMLSQLQEQFPSEAGEEASADVEQGEAEGIEENQEEGMGAIADQPPKDDDSGKRLAKSRAAALIASSMK